MEAKSEWIYTNKISPYEGPDWIDDSNENTDTISITPGAITDLFFNGGGKDSLVSMKILGHCQIPFATISVSDDLYGRSYQQHDSCARVSNCSNTKENHSVYTTGTSVNSPLLTTVNKEDIKTFIQIEYEVYIFFGLLQCLSKNYQHLAWGFERSAEEGNLIKGFENVNHQWDKTKNFIIFIKDYIQNEIVENLDIYSVLGNIYDPSIFLYCNKHADDIALTHSCNMTKPWCFRCVKCAYTLFSLSAYIGGEANKLFGIDILNHPGLVPHVSDLLGENGQKPFECIGSKEEVILLFEVLRKKKLGGKAIDIYNGKRKKVDLENLFKNYVHVYSDSYLPHGHRDKILKEIKSTINQQKKLLQYF